MRNVALFGRPMAGPVIASISSIVYPPTQRAKHLHDTEEADAVRDEVRRVFRDDDALAEAVIGEPRDSLDDRPLRIGRRNHFEQAQISRRVEEVGAEPVPLEAVGSPLGKCGDGNAGRV